MDVRTTKPNSPWLNKAGRFVRIIKGKGKSRRFKSNVPKNSMGIWHGLGSLNLFLNLWQVQVYIYRTLNRKHDIYIYEWIRFELYYFVSFWNNQSNNTKPNLGIWLGVSHRFGSAICYWILNEKVKVISCPTVQHLTYDDKRNPKLKDISAITMALWNPHL